MRVKTNVKAGDTGGEAGRILVNHNQTAKGLRVKSKVKAGIMTSNHNQSVKGLRVKSNVKAGDGGGDPGRIYMNHNQTAARAR